MSTEEQTTAERYIFKEASDAEEFEQIHRLNYRTFVEEIPQHSLNSERRLVDRFHEENTYFICLSGTKVVGMVALRGQRPFSLDAKLELNPHLPPGCQACEVRLLTVRQNHRLGQVLPGLITLLRRECLRRGYDTVLISATVRQRRLYRHLGFIPFGPEVGTQEALYQPMLLTAQAFAESQLPKTGAHAVLLTPGPVEVTRTVRSSQERPLLSHRSEVFAKAANEVRRRLCLLTGAQRAVLFSGSGTLANEIVAGQLASWGMPGLILSNGEFGERLSNQAKRWGLEFRVLRRPWGTPFLKSEVKQSLREANPHWLWLVHCETSTGMLNDLGMFKTLCTEQGVRLCLDCVSSLGMVVTNLNGVALASGVSGKGLGAYPGLGIVLYQEAPLSVSKTLPQSLDLGVYDTAAYDGETQCGSGVPFTTPSNLVFALEAALKQHEEPGFVRRAGTAAWLRSALRAEGFCPVAPEECAAPGVVTLALPKTTNAMQLGKLLEQWGYFIGYQSNYLRERNWVQIAILGNVTIRRLRLLPGLIAYATFCVKEKDAPANLDFVVRQ